MALETPFGLLNQAGVGVGWTRAAQALADALPPAEIDGIWLFRPVRRAEREWGVAVVSRRAENGRLRIYTVSYMLVVRGRERGQCKVAVEEVGESPPTVLQDVIAGVRDRAGEDDAPVDIDPALWYPPDDEKPPPVDGLSVS